MELLKHLTSAPLNKYKLHAARYNGQDQPLDIFTKDRSEWNGWNSWFETRHEANRPYIFSLIDYYPERHAWLFGGIYAVKNYQKKPPVSAQRSRAYDIALMPEGRDLIGRLKVSLEISRGKMFNLERHVDKIGLLEIMRRPYTGPTFPGYDNASLSYDSLCAVIANDRSDWKTALQHRKGVYLITLEDGTIYVGSAYGKEGIWSRWRSYAKTRHGGNREMRRLDVQSQGGFITGAIFTVIEDWPFRTEDNVILEREAYWKRALLSREVGMNRN